MPIAGSVLWGATNVDGAHETPRVLWCPLAAGHPDNRGIRLEPDLHPRAGSPPSQDDAFEQGIAGRIRPAPDERAERTVAVHDLVHGLESSDVAVYAPLSPKHLRDERTEGTIIGKTIEETKEWSRRHRRRRGEPLREGDDDRPVLVVVVALASRHDGGDLEQQCDCSDEQGNPSVARDTRKDCHTAPFWLTVVPVLVL